MNGKSLEVPKVFTRRTDNGQEHGYYPFSYDEAEKSFYIADQKVPANELGWSTCMKLKVEGALEGMQPDLSDIAEQTLLVPGFGNILGGRKLHEWLAESPERIGEAVPVMKDTYAYITQEDSELMDSNLWGFGSGLKEDGTLHLNVIGDCACLGVLPDSFVLKVGPESRFEEGFAEYSLHNIDTEAQLASIYSGIGHLARLASES